MTPHLNLVIQQAPTGAVSVRAYGPLHANTNAAWVARSMIELAAPLFVGGYPVELLGDSAATEASADDFCQCHSDLGPRELATLRCNHCGKGLLT